MRRALLWVVLTVGVVGMGMAFGAKGQGKGAVAPSGSINNEDCGACHEEVVKGFDRNVHAVVEKGKEWGRKNSCESCHGPGEAHAGADGDKTKIVGFKGEDVRGYNGKCLACHRGSAGLMAYGASRHGKSGLACTECHRVHEWESGTKLLRGKEAGMCLGCHVSERADFVKPYHHRVKEGGMKCGDCHDPHSGTERGQVKVGMLGDSVCVKCHTGKQGPFVFEHASTKIRGCEACHESHGSVNPKMLVRPTVRALCLECHSGGPSALTAQPPSIHDVRNPRYQNCTTCHVKVHGSNSSRLFLR
jgi:DmsE family decaheme c-type cytochrome